MGRTTVRKQKEKNWKRIQQQLKKAQEKKAKPLNKRKGLDEDEDPGAKDRGNEH